MKSSESNESTEWIKWTDGQQWIDGPATVTWKE